MVGGGGSGEAGHTAPQCQPIASCPRGGPPWPEAQNFYGKLENVMITCILLMFKCC